MASPNDTRKRKKSLRKRIRFANYSWFQFIRWSIRFWRYKTAKNKLGFELHTFPSQAHCDLCFSLKVDIQLVRLRGLAQKALKSRFFFHFWAPKLLVCVFHCFFNVQKLLFVRKKKLNFFERNACKMQIWNYIVKNSYIRKITSHFGAASQRG